MSADEDERGIDRQAGVELAQSCVEVDERIVYRKRRFLDFTLNWIGLICDPYGERGVSRDSSTYRQILTSERIGQFHKSRKSKVVFPNIRQQTFENLIIVLASDCRCCL